MLTKPELLVPVGSIESFHAAREAGADAVYLGLKKFNARGRAKNLTYNQLQELCIVAKKHRLKVYITLNTVVKNAELAELLEVLQFLSQIKVDAIIIQDWGVYHIAKNYFPNLILHASTQMGNHNSVGMQFSKDKGIKRVVLSRETTLSELDYIQKNTDIETEVFVHGALCYSLSGMCLFSSYLGGRGANRGLCAQPCRRSFAEGKNKRFVFNLKDNQQLDQLGNITKTGVRSLKIEGRMKSADYTYRVTKAYRNKLDNSNVGQDFDDLARPKTTYFLGGNVGDGITDQTMIGKWIGNIEKIADDYFYIKTSVNIQVGNRIRIQRMGSDEKFNLKIKDLIEEDGLLEISNPDHDVKVDDQVYLVDINEKKFPSKFKDIKVNRIERLNYNVQKKILNSLRLKETKQGREEVFVRINSMQWLRKINLNEVDGLILSFSKKGWGSFDAWAPFIQKFKRKIYLELPKFIPEKSLPFYTSLVKKLASSGIDNVFVSHLSQSKILGKKSRVFTNENVYVFNDAVVKVLQKENVNAYIYPLENDFENLLRGSSRNGIVPVYFYPELFHSRMPIKLENDETVLENDEGAKFRRFRKDGITSIVPEVPVSLLQYKNKLKNKGFHRYLIDVSYDNPSKNLVKKLLTRLKHSEQVQPSTTFNFRKELQ